MSQKHPRVSIGMPVYNSERFISEALEAFLAQTFQDFELIISDNASTDRTEQICRSYAARDARIQYFRAEKNLGMGWNYRRVFELSRGEYFRWATYDDLCAPESLARCVEVLDREPSVVLAYPKTKLIDEQGKVISEYEDRLHLQSSRASERFAQLFQRLGLCNAVYGLLRPVVLRRTALIGNYIASDVCFLTELSLYGKFWEIPEFLFYRRIHPGAYSSQKTTQKLLHFYTPQTKARISLTNWRHLWENFRAIERAPLEMGEKMRLRAHLLRMGIWNRDKLLGELSAATRHITRRTWGLVRGMPLRETSE